MESMTFEQQEQARQDRLNEVGTEPPCPFCHVLRVERSNYIRCNHCGINWANEEMHLPNYLSSDPRVARRAAALTEKGTLPTAEQQAGRAE